MFVTSFPTPEIAEQVVATLRRLEAQRLLQLHDVEYCSRDEDGRIRMYASSSRPLAAATLGAFWGTFLGKCFGAPLVGAAIGAAGGALVSNVIGSGDGIDKGFVRDLTATLAPGASAVFALVSNVTPDKVLAELGIFGGTILHTSLSDDDEARLQSALDLAYRKASTVESADLNTPVPRPRRIIRH